MFLRRCSVLNWSLAFAAVAAGCLVPSVWAAGPKIPWVIRPHYEFPMSGNQFYYNPQRGEWGICIADGKMLIDTVKSSVTLADGSALSAPEQLGKDDVRERFTDAIGTGNRITAEIVLGHGLVMHSSYRNYGDRPFGLLDLTVENRGEQAVTIAKISPAVFPAEECAALSDQTEVATRHVRTRGGQPVYAPGQAGQAVAIQDPAGKAMLVLAAIPQGVGRTEVRFESQGGRWQGEAACVFDPPVRLDPGQRLAADTLFLACGTDNAAQVGQNYAWVTSLLAKPEEATVPSVWVSVKDGESANTLYAAMHAWDGCGVRYALVPNGWEGRAGSFEGGPDYPRNMKEVAQTIQGAGMTPGLTLDPLAASASKSWCVSTDDGQSWINFLDPEGVAQAKKNVEQAVAAGFRFFVVAPLSIPDAVLKQLNATRTQADWAAFAIVREAAKGMPVFPAAAATLGGDVDGWLQASAATSRLREYGIPAGPVRLDVGTLDKIDEPLLSAMRFYGGPVELVGRPNADVRTGVSRLAASEFVPAQALDFAARSPHIWQVHARGQEDGYRGDAVVVFPGARAWSVKELDRESDAPQRLWTLDGDKVVLCDAPTVPAATNYHVYGVAPALPRPVLMGAPNEPDLLLKQLTKLRWDDGTSELSGCFHGNSTPAVAYVYVPEGWGLRRGTMGNDPVKAAGDDRVVALKVPAGASAPFQLSFRQE